MGYKYTVLKSQYVMEKLGQGATVLCVDFTGMRLMDCGDMVVNTLQKFIADGVSVFYLKEAVTNG